MTRDELINKYFNWMYSTVCNRRARKYSMLLAQLYNIDFNYTIPIDGCRAEDGINLRYRFGRELNYDDALIATYLDDCPCSILEMMVALAIRCEEHIMDDPDIGDRTGYWFFEMIDSLGLSRFDDDFYAIYSDCYIDVDKIIDIFLNREYGRNGKGGLFTVKGTNLDMRSVDIWYQMCSYLNSILSD